MIKLSLDNDLKSKNELKFWHWQIQPANRPWINQNKILGLEFYNWLLSGSFLVTLHLNLLMSLRVHCSCSRQLLYKSKYILMVTSMLVRQGCTFGNNSRFGPPPTGGQRHLALASGKNDIITSASYEIESCWNVRYLFYLMS